MRDRALFAAAAVLAGMGVLVDFTSAFLSMLADALMMGAVLGVMWLMLRGSGRRVAELERENAQLLQALRQQQGRATIAMLNPRVPRG